MSDSATEEQILRFFGIGRNNVAQTSRLRSLCLDSYNNVQELRAILLAFAGDNIPCNAFFDPEGKPYTFGDVCQQAKAQVKRIRAESKDSRGSFQRFLMKWTKVFVGAFGGLMAPSQSVAAMNLGATLLVFTWLDDRSTGKLKRAINQKIKQESKAWSSKINTVNTTHIQYKDILENACLSDSSIRNVRLYIMEHYPTMTARVLIHPDGRLLTQEEICKAVSAFA